jgi:hypothetical protein
MQQRWNRNLKRVSDGKGEEKMGEDEDGEEEEREEEECIVGRESLLSLEKNDERK